MENATTDTCSMSSTVPPVAENKKKTEALDDNLLSFLTVHARTHAHTHTAIKSRVKLSVSVLDP